MSTYKNMSITELEEAIAEIMAKQQELKQQKLAIHTALDAKLKEAEAKRKLERMSDDEKRAMLQELQTAGIGSTEEFGQV